MKIAGPAILAADGTPRWLPIPATHYEVSQKLFTPEETPLKRPSGFVTDDGAYVDRREARRIAVAAGQVVDDRTYQPHALFSEDFVRAAPDGEDTVSALTVGRSE